MMSETILTMIKNGENDHIEFKMQSLWSANFSKEEILSTESSEIRKYRNNASKFIIARSIAGFLNTDGGDLIIGIQEDRIKNTIRIVGIEEDYHKLHEKDRNPDGYRRMLVDSDHPEIYSGDCEHGQQVYSYLISFRFRSHALPGAYPAGRQTGLC